MNYIFILLKYQLFKKFISKTFVVFCFKLFLCMLSSNVESSKSSQFIIFSYGLVSLAYFDFKLILNNLPSLFRTTNTFSLRFILAYKFRYSNNENSLNVLVPLSPVFFLFCLILFLISSSSLISIFLLIP